MNQNLSKNISQCHNALKNQGFCLSRFMLPEELFAQVTKENYESIDKMIKILLTPSGKLFTYLQNFCDVKSIEHIISLREAVNEWEEDGIWHDDGSRILAFSLSLTTHAPEGGILEIRKKGESTSAKIPTPKYGEIIIFKTGIDNYEHKINRVTKGKRLIIAGWCYPDSKFL